jgi:hypothetical protein
MPGGPGGLSPMTNTVGADPYLKENIDWIRQRRDASNAQGQKQRAYGDIDSMANQASHGIEAAMARRGIGNSGIAIEGQKENLDAAGRAKVRAGMDIDAQEQQRQDQLALQAANIMRAPSAYNLAQQGQNLNNWQAQAGQGNFMAQFAQQQQNGQTQNYMDLMKMFGNVPGGAPVGGGGGGGGLTQFQNPNNRVLGPGGNFPGGQSPWGSVYNDPWFKGYGASGGGGGGGFGLG